MAGVDNRESSPQEVHDEVVRTLILRSYLWEVLTFAAVILVSPISFVLGLPMGISPASWLASWQHWTVVFIIIAFIIAILGFGAASSYRLKAERARG